MIERGFEIHITNFGDVSVHVIDPNDPRGGGCSALRGESGYGQDIESAIVEACTAARDDRYPQATACGRAVKPPDLKTGEHSTCVLAKVHEGACRDAEGNIDTAAYSG